ncbi:hypothetical protein [Inhella proteolytica]|uniref:Peptidase S8/S53 domain-containing protein n=1 Tax=Inhella proteolytica TaxID=2795029 RepID=A0A931J5R7_9BURK|nr:hypothetical protein [Inhella proteolytica]MBH9576832.1 hypothetical protein [Inhella proteolytica]
MDSLGLNELARTTLNPQDELHHYGFLGFPPARPIDHATQMLDLMAGPHADDAASRARLALVALRPRNASQLGDAPPGPDILAALRFLLGCTSSAVLVTIAMGCCWGPRDGSTPFELAVEALLKAHPRLMVVWAGGGAERMAGAGWLAELQAGETLHIEWQPEAALDREEHLGLWWSSAQPPCWRLQAHELPAAPWIDAHEPVLANEGARLACRSQAASGEAVLTLEPASTSAWHWELQARSAMRLQLWLMRPPQRGWLRADRGRRPVRTLWNGLAGSPSAGVTMAQGRDVPDGVLAWPIPSGGIPATAGLSGELRSCGGSSAAAALASRALFNQMSAQGREPNRHGDWQGHWQEVKRLLAI